MSDEPFPEGLVNEELDQFEDTFPNHPVIVPGEYPAWLLSEKRAVFWMQLDEDFNPEVLSEFKQPFFHCVEHEISEVGFDTINQDIRGELWALEHGLCYWQPFLVDVLVTYSKHYSSDGEDFDTDAEFAIIYAKPIDAELVAARWAEWLDRGCLVWRGRGNVKRDHYRTLGVPKGAGKDSVKRAFRRKAKATHPDAGGDRERFMAVQLAYEVLGDEQRRARYDATGEDGTERKRQEGPLETLAKLAIQVVGTKGHPGTYNLVEEMRAACAAQKEQLENKQANHIAEMSKFRAAADRIANGGENTIRAVLERQAQQHSAVAAELNETIAGVDAVAAALDGYSYRTDHKSAAPAFTFSAVGKFGKDEVY